MSRDLEEIVVESKKLDQPLLLDEESIIPERCTVIVSREKAYYLIAFQVLFFLGLVIFVIVFGIKILG